MRHYGPLCSRMLNFLRMNVLRRGGLSLWHVEYDAVLSDSTTLLSTPGEDCSE